MALPEVPHLVKLEGSLSGGEVLAELASGNQLVLHRRPPVRTVALFWSLEGARRFLAVAPAPVTQDEKHATASTIGARRPQGFAGRLRQWRYRLGYAFESQWHLLRRRGFGGWLRANFG